MPECELRKANGAAGIGCDEDGCLYWRVLEHLDLPLEAESGCAIQRFGLLAEGDGELASWLLSVKERVEGR